MMKRSGPARLKSDACDGWKNHAALSVTAFKEFVTVKPFCSLLASKFAGQFGESPSLPKT
jgi:hypothetical protein